MKKIKNNWTDQPAAVRSGEALDTEKLQTYLQENLPEIQGQLMLAQFPRGFSNLTYFLKIGEREFVLRRPPFGTNIKSAHDMPREFNVLSHLAPVYAKAPKPLLYCDDDRVIGAPFYIMERVEGVILRPNMPVEIYPKPQLMAGIAAAFVDCFVELHAVDYAAAGLADLGKPSGYIQRQVEGWAKRYIKAKTDDIPEIEYVARWLKDHIPAEKQVSLIHNDFKYDNIVLDSQDWSQVIAVLDWEMATLGDPLMDLGTSLAYWLDPDDPPELRKMQLSPTTIPGNPRRIEIAERYATLSGQDISDIVFYYSYGLFKIAVIIQQIYARYKKGYTKDKRFAGLIHGVRGCALMAAQSIKKNRIDRLF